MSDPGNGNASDKNQSDNGKAVGALEVPEAEHAYIATMKFYTHAQKSDGTVYANEVTGDAGLDYFYNRVDGDEDETAPDEERAYAKPLISVYLNGLVEGVEGVDGFAGFGLREAYGAVSLDDGVTWKNTNLSESSDKYSSDVVRKDVKLYKELDGNYPGDVTNIFHAVAGNKVVVAWKSPYCSSGQPNYSLDGVDDEGNLNTPRRAAIADYMEIDFSGPSPDDLYLLDMFGVAGSQGSVDYTEDKWEANHAVGEVPFNCLWTARGELVNGDDPRTEEVVEESFMRWFNAERLTSGRRDVNRIEVMGVEGAGFALTWQEDPDGLRPGQGEGPGEGWSGAIANNKTDVWYSYIDYEDFSIVQHPDYDYEAESNTVDPWIDLTGGADANFEPTDGSYEALAVDTTVSQKPKPFVPFAMPMRLTDNDKCSVQTEVGEDETETITGTNFPYCFGSAFADRTLAETTIVDSDEGGAPVTIPLDPLLYDGLRDSCASIIQVQTGRHDAEEGSYVCVTEDGVPLLGNTATTRPRLNLYGYDSNDDDAVDSAFALVVSEEDKGLGKFGFVETTAEDGTVTIDYTQPACDPELELGEDGYVENCVGFDEGKNMQYYSFSMSLTDLAVQAKDAETNSDGLVNNLLNHGGMLNQPEVNWTTGEFYGSANTDLMWDFDGTTDDGAEFVLGDENVVVDYDIYNTEIARRGSLLAQDIAKADASTSGLIALPSWKQGIMNQGGPADVMTRRIISPKNWDLGKDGNPYAFRNMDCENRADPSPQYPEGVCLDPALNFSATTPDTCIDSTTGDTVACPTVDETLGTFGVGTTNPILQGKELDDGDENTKDSNTTKVLTWHQCGGEGTLTGDNDAGAVSIECLIDNTDDQSWNNPLDVAKGHRGFLDGDFVMMLYAWSPNWRLNVKGSDRYDLYIRRSFDGANSWTNTPSSYTHWDKTKFTGDGNVVCENYRTSETQ